MYPLRILIVVTSHAALGDTGKPTGVWLEELAVPYMRFVDARADVTITSIMGGKIPLDPRSTPPTGPEAPVVERFLADPTAVRALAKSIPLESVDATRFDALFLPGGHGTMFDFPVSLALASAVSRAWTAGRVVAAVCHGPAGLIGAVDSDGKPVVAGRRVSAFTNAEEDAVGLTRTVPFLLQSKLESLGAKVETGPKFEPFAIADGRLVSGQNPASSRLTADLTLQAIAAAQERDRF
ncbi:MAG TPA: type 1 glutamine amidotransferase domain-containing protein [Myxococcaceae bacterium]|nr:type 1 glutamine amidotransferase domain-containing protein [Myxococcaceae bacterium]